MDDISSKNNARHSIVEEDFGEAIQNIIKDLLETISVKEDDNRFGKNYFDKDENELITMERK